VILLFDSTPSVEIFGAAASAACAGTLGPHGKGRVRLRGEELAFAAVDPYVGEIEAFVRAVTTDVAPEVPGREGLRNVELLEGIAS
jgi:predicted dehydrogenase